MPLRIYNTLTREKELFEPVHPGRVNVYVCGPTVYDYPHMGHAKTYVAFDVVVRYLRYRGYDVLYVQNITDVGHLTDDADAGEDKIGKRAQVRGVLPMALVETYTREYFKAMDALHCVRPDISPRATGHVPEMIDLIQRLIAHGHAYEAEGNVYFDVESFREYGKLSRRRLDEQESSGRVELGAGKRNAADFALWKSAEGTGHVMRWNSPWGVGFPGWHIECSAMAMKYLGETLDIHGAGVDNLFPHNEDEIAQSECATHQPFVKYWMHNGTVKVDGEKMSKSKGNFTTVEDGIAKFGAEVLRFWVVASHYRSAIDYRDEPDASKPGGSVQDAARAFERLQTAVTAVERYVALPEGGADGEVAAGLQAYLETARAQFLDAMDDDFNTPAALAALFGLVTEMNRLTGSAAQRSPEGVAAAVAARELMTELTGVLGLELTPPANSAENDVVEPLMELVLGARQALRKAKDFAAADQLRNGLKELGIVVEDRPEGAAWRFGS